MFEKQYGDEEVAAARRKITAGTSSLRAAAAEIGCAPSTLSDRIKKGEAAEADARVRLGLRDRQPPRPTPRRADSEPEGTLAEADPLEVLRGALQATKANGQPDWQIRVRAAHTLATLPPEEYELELEPEPETVVYDRPPGSSPILHSALPSIFASATTSQPAPQPLPEPGVYLFQEGNGPMIPLVSHAADEDAQVHILNTREAAADILRAFGGDPRFLDPIPDTDPQPTTP